MEFQVSDPQSLLELCSSLHDRDAAQLQAKINKYLTTHSSATTTFLLLVDTDQEQLTCSVVGGRKLDPPVKFPAHDNSFNSALTTRHPVHLDGLSAAHKEELSRLVGGPVPSMLIVPALGQAARVAALVCLVGEEGTGFTERDILLVQECFRCTLGVLLNTIEMEEERRLKEQCQSLLTVARNLFTHLDDVTDLLREIMSEARHLTQAERCSLFLKDSHTDELVAKVFDGNVAEDGGQKQEVRIPCDQGIAGHVATTGKLLNIRDAYSHPLFYKGIDESTGFKTRNILCFPIKDGRDVIGVAELCNKRQGRCFTNFDEEIAVAFSIYCGISIIHSLMYQKVIETQHRNQLVNELMMYHMKITDEEAALIHTTQIPAALDIHTEFNQFGFIPRNLPEPQTPLGVAAMFQELGLLQKFRINKEVLLNFIVMVKKGYRDPPYHNWMHAFSVAHFGYLLIRNLRLVQDNYITPIESLALMVSCLCHDLDHRGTNNNFQMTSNSVLAALYSSEGSVMERHHFGQSVCILNSPGCNIFDRLSEDDYTIVMDLVRDIILATDLAHHLRIIGRLNELVSTGYDRDSSDHHKLLLCLLVTSCDLADQTKEWTSSKKTAELIYQEFFSQGDLEKAMGNRPVESMDRERACVPELQLQFIDDIALPVYTILAALFSGANESLQTLQQNKKYWQRMQELFRMRKPEFMYSMDALDNASLEEEVISSFKDN